MGVYAFRWPLLRDVLSAERVDFGRDVLPAMVEAGQAVNAYEYLGYWQDIGTVDAYWQASMDLLADAPPIDLYETGWLIYTRSEERAPARIGSSARVTRSMVSHGCVVDGAVERSILSPGVRVGAGAIVRESIVMFDTEIGPGAIVDRTILDKECVVGADARIGDGRVLRPNRSEPERLFSGLTLIGKQARIPARARIGRNCRIDPYVTEADFPRRRVAAGDTVVHAG
jgi:glucose-1-phosphate adenylyltransferase